MILNTGLYTGTGYFSDLEKKRILGLLEMAEAWKWPLGRSAQFRDDTDRMKTRGPIPKCSRSRSMIRHMYSIREEEGSPVITAVELPATLSIGGSHVGFT